MPKDITDEERAARRERRRTSKTPKDPTPTDNTEPESHETQRARRQQAAAAIQKVWDATNNRGWHSNDELKGILRELGLNDSGALFNQLTTLNEQYGPSADPMKTYDLKSGKFQWNIKNPDGSLKYPEWNDIDPIELSRINGFYTWRNSPEGIKAKEQYGDNSYSAWLAMHGKSHDMSFTGKNYVTGEGTPTDPNAPPTPPPNTNTNETTYLDPLGRPDKTKPYSTSNWAGWGTFNPNWVGLTAPPTENISPVTYGTAKPMNPIQRMPGEEVQGFGNRNPTRQPAEPVPQPQPVGELNRTPTRKPANPYSSFGVPGVSRGFGSTFGLG